MTAYELAKAEVGTVEWKDGSNPKVVAYFRDAGAPYIKDDETAWCAAFVGAMLKRAGGKGTGKLNARSYLEWGEKVELHNAKEGDIVVFTRGNSTWQGHVAFFVKDNGPTVTVLGGNQADSVSRKVYGKVNILGVRREPSAAPADVVQPIRKLPHNPEPIPAPPIAKPAQGWLAGLIRAIMALFGKGK